MRIWWAVALCACSNEPTQQQEAVIDAPPAHVALSPGACSGDEISIYGMGSSEATPVHVAAFPSTFCLALDGRDNIRIAHFAAGTPYEQASTASFQMALFDTSDVLMRESWDVNFGNGTVFANLEYGMPVGTVTHVKLIVDGPTPTDVALHLFEPYE